MIFQVFFFFKKKNSVVCSWKIKKPSHSTIQWAEWMNKMVERSKKKIRQQSFMNEKSVWRRYRHWKGQDAVIKEKRSMILWIWWFDGMACAEIENFESDSEVIVRLFWKNNGTTFIRWYGRILIAHNLNLILKLRQSQK